MSAAVDKAAALERAAEALSGADMEQIRGHLMDAANEIRTLAHTAAVRNFAIAQLAEDRDRFRDFAYLARERLHKIAKQCMCPDGRCAECAEIWSVLNQCPATVEHASTKVRK